MTKQQQIDALAAHVLQLEARIVGLGELQAQHERQTATPLANIASGMAELMARSHKHEENVDVIAWLKHLQMLEHQREAAPEPERTIVTIAHEATDDVVITVRGIKTWEQVRVGDTVKLIIEGDPTIEGYCLRGE